MGDEKDQANDAGLGKVVYSNDSQQSRQARSEASSAESEVDEGSEESFPASDPPSFTKTELAKADETYESAPDETG